LFKKNLQPDGCRFLFNPSPIPIKKEGREHLQDSYTYFFAGKRTLSITCITPFELCTSVAIIFEFKLIAGTGLSVTVTGPLRV
jgi:hypothetical protein